VQPEPEQILDSAVSALSSDRDWRAVLDALPAPVYTTDTEGAVTYWNSACVEFAGREPRLGEDRWCVTWQLYTTIGEPLRHEDCPMAQTVKQQVAVRDAIAIAERPDGSRRAFRPYPTPLFGADGTFTGAINVLIDVTEEQSEALHEQAERCRRLAGALYSRESNIVLCEMAERYEQSAEDLASKRKRRSKQL
jgi:PAS domain S-box-containing protein